MRVIVTAADIAQIPACDQATGGYRCASDQLFSSKAGESVGILINIQFDAVHGDLLADITGDQVIVITGLF